MTIVLRPRIKEEPDLVLDGSYQAQLTKINQFQNAYGDRIGFEFTLQDQAVAGLKVMRSTSTQLAASGKLADVLRGILGRELTATELSSGFDVESLLGMNCGVLVLQVTAKNGDTYSNVERVYPASLWACRTNE